MKDDFAKVVYLVRSGKTSRVDFHMHSNFSDGQSTIEEYVISARSKGLEAIAITDHVWRSSEWVDKYVSEIKELQRKYDSIIILAGLEAKVIDLDGNVDVSEEDRDKVDFIMAVVHRFLPEEASPYNDLSKLAPGEAAELETELTIKLIRNPRVDIIGHFTRTYYKFHFGNRTKEEFPEQLIRKVVREAAKWQKPMEYGTTLPSKDKLLRLCLKEGAPFTIGSDSHNAKDIGNIKYDELRGFVEDFSGRKD